MWLVRRLIPEAPLAGHEPVVTPRYLDALLLDTPTLALDAVRRETARMGQRVERMMERILPALLQGGEHALKAVARMDNEVDTLHAAIIHYLGEISKRPLAEAQTEELVSLMEAVNDLENIGDIIETNLVSQGLMRIHEGMSVSLRTQRVLGEVHAAVSEALGQAVGAVVENDPDLALQVIARKIDINRLLAQARTHQAHRLVAAEPQRVVAYRIEMDTLEYLRRVYYFSKRMARALVPSSDSPRPKLD